MSRETKQTVSMESNTRTISVSGNRIIYKLKLDGIEDYLTYNDTLLEILKLDKLKPFRDNGRLRFKVRENHTDINFYLYDLAFACYSGKVHLSSFLDDMQRYYEDKALQGLSIDHADNNIHNNTKLNISPMSRELNMSKSDIVVRVKEPMYLNTAYCDKKYRVQILFNIESEEIKRIIFNRFGLQNVNCSGGLIGLHFLCESAEEYVKCLKWITAQSYEWAEPLKDNRGYWIKNDGNCWCSDLHRSLQAQMILADMPIQNFQPFNL